MKKRYAAPRRHSATAAEHEARAARHDPPASDEPDGDGCEWCGGECHFEWVVDGTRQKIDGFSDPVVFSDVVLAHTRELAAEKAVTLSHSRDFENVLVNDVRLSRIKETTQWH